MANLTTVGNTELKGSPGSVVLADIVANRFGRTLAADGYARVNPFEVNKGNAPSEETAPHSLDDWNGYDHDRIESGSGLSVEVGYGELTVSWTQHAGYSLAPSVLRQLVYVKSMGTTEDLSVNPFSAPDDTDDAGDGTSHTMVGLTAGNFYAIGMKVEFSDSDAAILPPDSTACNPDGSEAPLIGAGEGISSGVAVFDDTPSIDSISQSPAAADCFQSCSGTDCPDFTLSVTMEGPSTGRLEVSTNGGSTWSLVDGNVPAGSSSLSHNDRNPGTTYTYRLRYNDVGGGSAGPWSPTAARTAECDQL